MPRLTRLVALIVSAVTVAAPLCAQNTPGPPEWQDRQKSVYAKLAPAEQPAVKPTIASAPIATTAKLDAAVVPAVHQEVAPASDSSGRRLAPPSNRQTNDKLADPSARASAGPRRLIDFGIPTQSMYTVGTALAIVVGAFLLFAWVLRRGGRGGRRRGTLPADAVSVLGRVALSGRQMAELLRVGNKLVLVALTPSGAETLTEVTDPVEVDRLMGLCQQHDRHSTTKAFEHVFQQMSREPAPTGDFFGTESLPSSISPVAAAYRSQRGGSRG